MTAVGIMWQRQIKRYWRSKSRIIGSLGQPLLFLLTLGLGLSPVFKEAGAGSYFDFLVPGVIGQAVLFMAIFSGVELIWDRQFGFLKETLAAPVSRLEIVLGRTLGGATIATIQGIIVFFLALLVGFRYQNWLNLFPVIAVMFLIALLFTALGTAIASLMEDFHGFQLIMNFLAMPLFFLSGALFPLKTAPLMIKTIVKFNPLSYGIDALRGLLTGLFQFSLFTDVLVLLIVSMFFLLVSSWLFKKIQI